MNILNQYIGKIVSTSRNWNNSMYIYMDSAVIYDNGEFKNVCVGDDVWDGHNPENIIAQTDISIRELYKSHLRKIKRDSRAKVLRELRATYINISRDANINYFAVKELYKLYGWDTDIINSLVRLLLTKNFRSNFRLSVANQLRDWLSNKSSRKYDKPLSPKQLESICRF